MTPWNKSVVAPIQAFPTTIETGIRNVGKETASLWDKTKAAKDVAPRDLSITAVAVAGGGTEIVGHPVRWPLLFAEQILGLIDQTLTRYLETYESCAQDRWQRDVTDTLHRIEQRLTGH